MKMMAEMNNVPFYTMRIKELAHYLTLAPTVDRAIEIIKVSILLIYTLRWQANVEKGKEVMP